MTTPDPRCMGVAVMPNPNALGPAPCQTQDTWPMSHPGYLSLTVMPDSRYLGLTVMLNPRRLGMSSPRYLGLAYPSA